MIIDAGGCEIFLIPEMERSEENVFWSVYD